MSDRVIRAHQVCRACDYAERIDYDWMLAALRHQGKLRRAKNPEVEMVLPLYEQLADGLTCDQCGRVGLQIDQSDRSQDEWDRPCDRCGATIPAERVELFPDSRFCVTCQQAEERGDVPADEVEYCPACGAILQLKRAGGDGLARYAMACTECRWSSR